MLNLTQNQLDNLATLFGTIAGIAELLVATERLSNGDGQFIAGLALIALGIVSNKKPRNLLRGEKVIDDYLKGSR
jgi:hypothetical protein